jgi:hypothetical protein
MSYWDNNRDELLRCKDDGETMQVLGSYMENVTNRDTTMPTVDHTYMMCTDNVPKKKRFWIFSVDILNIYHLLFQWILWKSEI